MYRAFEDVEELERDRGGGEEEESPFRPYPVENGSDHEEENGTNGTGKAECYIQKCPLFSFSFFLAIFLSSD